MIDEEGDFIEGRVVHSLPIMLGNAFFDTLIQISVVVGSLEVLILQAEDIIEVYNDSGDGGPVTDVVVWVEGVEVSLQYIEFFFIVL